MADEKIQPIRVVITGPESSGKTTLARDLAIHFDVAFVPEYARPYLAAINRDYNTTDLDNIAKNQLNLQSNSIEAIQICDTGPMVLKIWSLEVFGGVSPVIDDYLGSIEIDLYILCCPDIPWEADRFRVNPNDRQRLFDRYVRELMELTTPICIVSRDHDSRLAVGIEAIDGFIS